MSYSDFFLPQRKEIRSVTQREPPRNAAYLLSLRKKLFIKTYILSGTLIPINPIADLITLAVIKAMRKRSCFFSPDSAVTM